MLELLEVHFPVELLVLLVPQGLDELELEELIDGLELVVVAEFKVGEILEL